MSVTEEETKLISAAFRLWVSLTKAAVMGMVVGSWRWETFIVQSERQAPRIYIFMSLMPVVCLFLPNSKLWIDFNKKDKEPQNILWLAIVSCPRQVSRAAVLVLPSPSRPEEEATPEQCSPFDTHLTCAQAETKAPGWLRVKGLFIYLGFPRS